MTSKTEKAWPSPSLLTGSGYPWRVAPQQSPLPFHRTTQDSKVKKTMQELINERASKEQYHLIPKICRLVLAIKIHIGF
jgi:hypothetical protein